VKYYYLFLICYFVGHAVQVFIGRGIGGNENVAGNGIAWT